MFLKRNANCIISFFSSRLLFLITSSCKSLSLGQSMACLLFKEVTKLVASICDSVWCPGTSCSVGTAKQSPAAGETPLQ